MKAAAQFAMAALLFATPTLAQVQPPHLPGTLRVEVSLVTVGVRVTDAEARAVAGLGRNNFKVYENGVAQQIAFFSSDPQPISFAVLLDRSDSMKGDKFNRAKVAAQLLIEKLHQGSEFAYIPFDATWSEGEFYEDRGQVIQGIGNTQLGEGTRMFDAILAALDLYKRARNARQAMILITDGADMHSDHMLVEVIRSVQESHVQLYAIGYFNGEEAALYWGSGPLIVYRQDSGIKVVDNPRFVFARLARESGAEAFFPETDQELAEAAETISNELHTQYTIAYYPSNPARDGTYRRIKVTVQGKRGLKVRAREGYLAPR